MSPGYTDVDNFLLQKLLGALILISIPLLFLHLTKSSIDQLEVKPNSQLRVPLSEPCQCSENSSDYYIIRLHKPWHHFDSNHWFHSKFIVLIQYELVSIVQLQSTIYHGIALWILVFLIIRH